jgi:hypothetical protein
MDQTIDQYTRNVIRREELRCHVRFVASHQYLRRLGNTDFDSSTETPRTGKTQSD